MQKIILVLLSFGFLFAYSPAGYAQTQNEEHIEAVVTSVIENSQVIEENKSKHLYQKLQLLGTSGSFRGKTFVVENGKIDQVGITEYKKGDKIVLTVGKDFSGKNLFTISDYVRRTPLYILTAIFLVLTILIGGRRGFMSLVGMGITFALIFLFVLPQVANGASPILITSIAGLFVIPATFFLAHGINKKTISAILGTLIALLISGVLASIFIDQTHLTGFASEEAGFLDVIKKGAIDIRGLLFAGILIALIGILEDITISQAAIVFQLKEANKKLTSFELFKRAMNVGRDHIASMANTLILVYAGASLPLLLLFIDNPLPFSSVINFEIIAEEIVRTLVASIGLILAVPLTTAITSFIVWDGKDDLKKA